MALDYILALGPKIHHVKLVPSTSYLLGCSVPSGVVGQEEMKAVLGSGTACRKGVFMLALCCRRPPMPLDRRLTGTRNALRTLRLYVPEKRLGNALQPWLYSVFSLCCRSRCLSLPASSSGSLSAVRSSHCRANQMPAVRTVQPVNVDQA